MLTLVEDNLKVALLEKLVNHIVVEYDEKSNFYYIGLPSNLVLHTSGNFLIKSDKTMIIDGEFVHLAPPKNLFERVYDKVKALIKE